MLRTMFHAASTRELDLRLEFDKLCFGDGNSPKHGRFVLVRKFRKLNNKRVDCSCKNAFTKEGYKVCPYCEGEGFLWDEHWSWCLATEGGNLFNRNMYLPPGRVNVGYKTFYFRFDSDISIDDKIVEVVLDQEGRPAKPYKRKTVWLQSTCQDMRSDNGRLEFYECRCKEEDAVRVRNE